MNKTSIIAIALSISLGFSGAALAQSEPSSEPSSAPSEVSSEAPETSQEFSCSDTTQITAPALDAAALAAVTSVTVFAVDDCSGIQAAPDTAAIGTNQAVIDAMAAAGETGAEIVSYTLDGTSLSVYVRSR